VSALRDAVREEATERTWSQGVTLARDRRVVGRGRTNGEIELEVRIPGRPTPFVVILDPARAEWECDCPSKEAVCSHVVAAVLATESGELPAGDVGASIRYLLEPATGGIAIARVLVRGEATEPLVGSVMSAIAAGRGNAIATIEADLLADQLISVRAGPIHGERLDRLLAVLADARDVRWRGDAVTTSADPVMPRAIVDDAPEGVRVRIEADPAVREVVAVGVVLTADRQLRPIGEVDLSGPRLDKLPMEYIVPRAALSELVGKTLPGLAQRIDVQVRATGLPQMGSREEPRISFDVEQDGDKLIVFPTLVYGDPTRARGGSP